MWHKCSPKERRGSVGLHKRMTPNGAFVGEEGGVSQAETQKMSGR